MTRIIDADNTVRTICGHYCGCERDKCGSDDPCEAVAFIEDAPTVSPDEARGKWLITDAYPHRVYCSVCYKTYLPNADWELWSDGRIPRNFCPNCGAKMEVTSDA